MTSTRPLTGIQQSRAIPLLSLSGITKSFSSILANSNIKLSLNHGEIHALLGENGAGKSTLVKIVYGLISPIVAKCVYRMLDINRKTLKMHEKAVLEWSSNTSHYLMP